MRALSRPALAAFALSGLALVACSTSTGTRPTAAPATLETVPGTNQAVVRLTAAAAKRIDLQTGKVETKPVPARPGALGTAGPPATVVGPGGAAAPGDTEAPKPKRGAAPPPTTAPPPTAPAATQRTVVPFPAVLYQPSGDAFVYVDRGDLTFVRAAVGVDYVVDAMAVLSSGPAVGTAVVTLGSTQLLGVEAGVGAQELG